MRLAVARSPLAWAALAVVLWSGWFLLRGSLVIDGLRHPCVADDALISLSYARNFHDGYGLDWSRRGDRVEGFTHPLWLGLLLLLTWPDLPRATLAWSAPLLGLASLLVLLVVADRFARRRLGLAAASERALALVLVVSSFPVAYWSLLGMETALQAAFVVLAADLALAELEGEGSRQVALGVVGGLAVLLRPDLVFVWAIPFAALARAAMRADRRRWLAGALAFALPVAAWQVFRLAYFGDWLPNTYYLKLGDTDWLARLPRGAWTTARFLAAHLPLVLLAVAGARRFARPGQFRVVAGLVAVFPLYGLWIGGDAWDHKLPLTANRFQAVAVPLLALLAAAGIARLRPRISSVVPRPWTQRATLSLLVAGPVLLANVAGRPADAVEMLRQLPVSDSPLQCDATHHFVEQLYAFRRSVPEPATVGVVWAGVTGYYSDYRLYDELGFNDRRIAHQLPRRGRTLAEWRSFWPGHVKWDERLFLEEYRPQAFFQVWSGWGEGREERLHAAGYRRFSVWWLREDVVSRLGGRAAAARAGPFE